MLATLSSTSYDGRKFVMSMDRPEQGDGEEATRKVVDLIGGDLLTRDEWGEYHDQDDFRARDHLFLEAEMLVDGIDSTEDLKRQEQLLAEAERIKRFADALNRLQAYTYLAEASPEHSVLRPYQVPVMRDICDFFEYDTGERLGGLVVLPTGVGKTVIFNEIIHATGLKTLVVADTNEQVKQNHDKLHEHARGRETDAGIVDGHHKLPGKDATYTTYASLLNEMRKPAEERIIKPEEYDMVIYDEAHLALGDNRRTTLQFFKHAVKMAFTATDRYSEDKHVGVLFPVEITRMTLEEAEDKKLVAPHHNIIVQTRMDMRHVPVASTGDYAQDVLFSSINTDERNLVVVETYQKLHFGKKVIDFCGGIQHAKDLAKMYQEHGIPAEAVWGDMSDEDRKRIFKEFREGKLWHITNADLVSTGFDMKSVECVYMLQPSLSVLRTMQIGGRSNRTWEDMPNKVSYVVQFVDDEYAQPPVLFAEPGASGFAQHGWEGFVFPEIDTSGLPYNVLTDPADIEWLALEHHEARKKKSTLPPFGWANFDELRTLSGRPMNHVKKAYSNFVNSQEEILRKYRVEGRLPGEGEVFPIESNTGLFVNPTVHGGRKRYLSPELVHRMAEFLEQYRVKDSLLWRRASEVAEIYGKSTGWVSNSVLFRVRNSPEMKQYEAQLVEHPDSVRKLLHFHFEMLKAGIEKNGLHNVDPNDLLIPPERMHSEELVRGWLEGRYGEGAFDLAISRSHKYPLGWGDNAESVVYEVDGKRKHFYSPKARWNLESQLLPSRGFKSLADILLKEEGLAEQGVTQEMVQAEAQALLDKEPRLGYQLRQFFNTETNCFEYYGIREVHVHIYERLVRRQHAERTEKLTESILELLEKSSLLVKPPEEEDRGSKTDKIDEEQEPEDLNPPEVFSESSGEAEEIKNTSAPSPTHLAQERLQRAREVMERYQRYRQSTPRQQ